MSALSSCLPAALTTPEHSSFVLSTLMSHLQPRFADMSASRERPLAALAYLPSMWLDRELRSVSHFGLPPVSRSWAEMGLVKMSTYAPCWENELWEGARVSSARASGGLCQHCHRTSLWAFRLAMVSRPLSLCISGPCLIMTGLGTAACQARGSASPMVTFCMSLMPLMMSGGRQGW